MFFLCVDIARVVGVPSRCGFPFPCCTRACCVRCELGRLRVARESMLRTLLTEPAHAAYAPETEPTPSLLLARLPFRYAAFVWHNKLLCLIFVGTHQEQTCFRAGLASRWPQVVHNAQHPHPLCFLSGVRRAVYDLAMLSAPELRCVEGERGLAWRGRAGQWTRALCCSQPRG